MPKPDPREQVAFLGDLQRLLDEGQFTATYKFALILALAELSVERGNDSGEPLALPVAAIAERFVALYWGHARPFPGAGIQKPTRILSQNRGKNISIMRKIATIQERHPTLAGARRSPRWAGLVAEVAAIVLEMPLFRLQNLRGGPANFLYDNNVDGGAIVLKPWVAHHLRHFHVLVQHLVRGAWVRHVRSNPRNHAMLGDALDLEQFLFGAARTQYPQLKETLRELQRGNCFYCTRPIPGVAALDHFIPWARYPSDLGHNFVLTDRKCNTAKSDLLAEERFRDAWEERNMMAHAMLEEAFSADAVPHDFAATNGIAAWAYSRAAALEEALWSP